MISNPDKPTTLITGAGKRIGAEIAKHLVSRGHDLVLHYHRARTEAKDLATELRAMGAEVVLVQANLEDTASLDRFWQGLPPVTTIIHNASRYTRDTLENFTAADLRDHIAINFEAPLILTQGFMRQLPATATGNIIAIGDDALRWSISPHFFTYAISKHSWRAMIDILAAAVAPRARANVLALAPTMPGENDPDGLFERLATISPLARTGSVAEVTAAVDYLLTACGITGEVIGLGNGMNLATHRA